MTTSTADVDVTIDVYLGPDDLARALRDDARRGLTASPKWIPSKWFYDDRGSDLFDRITRLPEYYPTRREREILLAHAPDIAAAARFDTLVELGSGTSEKTRVLLRALAGAGALRTFAPFDVSAATLERAGRAIADEFPGVGVHGIVGDFERHLDRIPPGGRRLVAFLGGTIGNLDPGERTAFYTMLRRTLARGEALLLGTDLVKAVPRLHAAYNDADGVTAEFNRNVLRVLNRELDADFPVDAFEHVAFFDSDHEWIEMRLRAAAACTVTVGALDHLAVPFAAGEELRTEISAKFQRAGVEAELAAAGFALRHWWTDAGGDFALSLSFAD
jgi:L-histidine N-alpha-methyltransferase